MGRIPKDALPLYMPRNHVNGLMAALDLIIHTDEKNEMAISAQKLKDKILRYGKAFQSNGEDCVTRKPRSNRQKRIMKASSKS